MTEKDNELLEKDKGIEDKNNGDKKKTYPFLSFFLLIFSILLLGLSLCLLFVEDFIKVSLTLSIVSSLLFIISHNLNKSLNVFYFVFLMILVIYALISTYAFKNEDLMFHGFIVLFCFNLIYIIGKIFDLKKIENNVFLISSFVFLPILLISNIVLFSLYSILGYMITTILMICISIIFLLYDITYEYLFFIKTYDKKSEN